MKDLIPKTRCWKLQSRKYIFNDSEMLIIKQNSHEWCCACLQSSIRTPCGPTRIFGGYLRDIPKLYWEYTYCLPSNKYYIKNVLMSPYKHWMNLTCTPIKPLYTIQYCYDMHCHTWTRKTTCRENSCIIGGYKTQCMNHTEYSEAVKLNLDSTSNIHIFQNSTLLKSYIIITSLKYVIFINI